ncbi:hypothetical protein Taro_038442 [Colocasia esculenta]|uniref:Uncharacterized protein n=1 Tax=Colocasia esculenta TaxID=4460 RepID=A0A843W3H8_COLES|nr:hypothetical protein [Colocasia esculenta]
MCTTWFFGFSDAAVTEGGSQRGRRRCGVRCLKKVGRIPLGGLQEVGRTRRNMGGKEAVRKASPSREPKFPSPQRNLGIKSQCLEIFEDVTLLVTDKQQVESFNWLHYIGKSFDDVIASVPAGVNPQDWQIMCAKWNTLDEQNIADRNKEMMIQLSTPSLDSESGSTPISAKETFVSGMGKDRSGCIRCGGSWETRRTWYGTGEGSSCTDYQQQISNIENTLRMEVEELHTEARRRDSEMDEMRRELEQLHKRESEMDDIHR